MTTKKKARRSPAHKRLSSGKQTPEHETNNAIGAIAEGGDMDRTQLLAIVSAIVYSKAGTQSIADSVAWGKNLLTLAGVSEDTPSDEPEPDQREQ